MVEGEEHSRQALRWSRIVYDTVARPVRSASLFYGLYYLSEIEGKRTARKDLEDIAERLEEGFYYYGVASIVKELGSMPFMMTYEGEQIAKLNHSKRLEFINNYFEPQYRPLVADIIEESMGRDMFIGMRNKQSLERGLRKAEVKLNAMSEHEKLIRAARLIFEVGSEKRDNPEERRQRHKEAGVAKWKAAFGGEQWAGIARHMENKGKYSSIMWVDQAWALEHNTNNWVNKVDVSPMEREKVARTAEQSDRYPKRGNEDNRRRSFIDKVLKYLLDSNKEGNMLPVFQAAILYDQDVETNLSGHAFTMFGSDVYME